MVVKQIYELINSVSGEVLGKTDIVKEDLTGVVDLGNEVFNQGAVDNYVKSLVNHIGKVIFVNRPYAGKIPSVLMDAWEFGSAAQSLKRFQQRFQQLRKTTLGISQTVTSTNRTFSTSLLCLLSSSTQRLLLKCLFPSQNVRSRNLSVLLHS